MSFYLLLIRILKYGLQIAPSLQRENHCPKLICYWPHTFWNMLGQPFCCFLHQVSLVWRMCTSWTPMQIQLTINLHSGQRTYSLQTRFVVLLRLIGVLDLLGLTLSIAGGVLGSPTSLSQSKVGLILREVAAGIYAGMYVMTVFAYTGALTYRWHLRSYRRRVRIDILPCIRLLYDIFLFCSSCMALAQLFRSLACESPIPFLQPGLLPIFLVPVHRKMPAQHDLTPSRVIGSYTQYQEL